jgi:hypothetical protein
VSELRRCSIANLYTRAEELARDYGASPRSDRFTLYDPLECQWIGADSMMMHSGTMKHLGRGVVQITNVWLLGAEILPVQERLPL